MAMNPAPVTETVEAKRTRKPSKKYLIVDVDTKETFLADEYAAAKELNYSTLLVRLHAAYADNNEKVIRVPSNHSALQVGTRAGRRLTWIEAGKVFSGFEVPAGAEMVIDFTNRKYSVDGATYLDIDWTDGVFLGKRKEKAAI